MVKRYTFIDLFAGAGGISEGFLQAHHGGRLFEFLLASDINENCELTHRARYNHQLGLPAEFIRMDIQDPAFMDELLRRLKGRRVDVVCGGPPCQSFSLAGRRRPHDKKNDLFSSYLEVIRVLRPRYFIMENVSGILTKDSGLLEDRIIEDIRSIVDVSQLSDVFPMLRKLVRHVKRKKHPRASKINYAVKRLSIAAAAGPGRRPDMAQYAEMLEQLFKRKTRGISYARSKTDEDVNTVRHGLRLLRESDGVSDVRTRLLALKSRADVDNDKLAPAFDAFLSFLSDEKIVQAVLGSLEALGERFRELADAVMIFELSLAACMEDVIAVADETGFPHPLKGELQLIHLYNIKQPLVLNAADYGVPQDRKRVLFIGSRYDQSPFESPPAPTTPPGQRVTVYEALHDLDFIKLNEIAMRYRQKKQRTKRDIPSRCENGAPDPQGTRDYAAWCRNGRLPENGSSRPRKYFRNMRELADGSPGQPLELANHESSNHSQRIQDRLEVIRKAGSYKDAERELKKMGLKSKKRNYAVLPREGIAPTIVTLPDDFIHYARPRCPTVREMARLQSFDDDFVFQGKRTTGGDRRKDEVPQYTLIGNAVPPLVARAVAQELLELMD